MSAIGGKADMTFLRRECLLFDPKRTLSHHGFHLPEPTIPDRQS